ncbi:hypothetical protein Val02_39140 [Virgisporangium aliadipatigenens]|uniref:Uncharacterized protein n=1 Tax=Virgisporangium aliadipatigenens TaxID=741659 RepID=A0A8J3YMY1_9ACTN|nr:hypothetical protein [Virgisporangium aliadipatigenens]GIJ47028.1 hypothetical protein Val02_39140 [Virgisporangium aliadipatigenens]
MSERVIDGTWEPAGPDRPLPTPGATWRPVSRARRWIGRILFWSGLLLAAGVVLARINPGRFVAVVHLGLAEHLEHLLLPLVAALLLISAGSAIGARHRAAVNVGTALPLALTVLLVASWFPLSTARSNWPPDREIGVVARSGDGRFAIVRYQHRERVGTIVSLRIRSLDGWLSRESTAFVISPETTQRVSAKFRESRWVEVERPGERLVTYTFDPDTLAVRCLATRRDAC